jgi:hypothetical protein
LKKDIYKRKRFRKMRAHQATTLMKTIALLFRDENKNWTLATYKGDTIPTSTHYTRFLAMAHAKAKGWGVKRDKNCDAQ